MFNYVTKKNKFLEFFEYFVCNVSVLDLDVNKHGYRVGTTDYINNLEKIDW